MDAWEEGSGYIPEVAVEREEDTDSRAIGNDIREEGSGVDAIEEATKDSTDVGPKHKEDGSNETVEVNDEEGFDTTRELDPDATMW